MIISDCKCELCCEGELPGKESHLLSEFIIKETINKSSKANASGKNSKGHELLFNIMPDKGVGLFFRGSATEEAKTHLKKEEFGDEELPALSTMKNPLTDKYLVCAKCEDRFQSVEDNFKIIYDKLLSDIEEKPPEKKEFTLSETEQIETQLFLYTNLWRYSKSKQTTWRLQDEIEQCLTEIMFDTYIRAKSRDLFTDFLESKNKFNCINLIVFFDEEVNEEPEKPNSNFIFGYYSSDPYLVVANRLIIFISPSNFDLVGTPKICKNAIESLLEYTENPESKINYLETGKTGIINKNSAVEQLDIYYETLKNNYIIFFEEELKRVPTVQEVNAYMTKALFHIGEQYKFGESENALIELMKSEAEKCK